MLDRNPGSINEMQYQETYASLYRTENNLQNSLSGLLENYSLSDQNIGDPEDIYYQLSS